MNSKILKIALLTFFIASYQLSVISYQSFAQREEEKRIKYPLITQLPPKEKPPLAKLFDIRPYISILSGYDNNVNLSSARKGDFLTEELFGLRSVFNLAKDLKARFSYTFTNIGYYEIKDTDLRDHLVSLSLEKKIGSRWIIRPHYRFDGVDYIHNTLSSYLENSVGLKVRYNITKKLYNSFDYSYVYRDYHKRRIVDYGGTTRSRLRKDDRNVFEYEVGSFHIKNALVKFKGRYYFNDSSYQNEDFFDYNDTQFSLSMTNLLTKKLTTFTSLGYEMRDYKSRNVPNINVAQEDKIYKITTALFYDMTKNMNLNITYSWRQNDSNDPQEKYAGFIVTSGLTYTF